MNLLAVMLLLVAAGCLSSELTVCDGRLCPSGYRCIDNECVQGSICGNGVIEDGEVCDNGDGNNGPGTGCNFRCQ